MEKTKQKETYVPNGKESQDAIFIAVMGITGAGKSSFISQCCPDAENIIGIALDSFTQECMLYRLQCQEKTVYLIDTPGFNDTKRKDIEVLKEVAFWLASSYQQELRLNGIIFLHGIHNSRFAGSDFTNLKMFKELTGMAHMSHVVLTTSYWDVTPEHIGVMREKLLLENDDFWKLMKDAGATVQRFKNDKASAISIIETIVTANQKTTLQIQSEMSSGNINLNQTSAGRELDKELNEHIEQNDKELAKKTAELTKAFEEKDQQAAEAALQEQDRLKKERIMFEEKKKQLDIDTEALLREKDNQIKAMKEETERLKLEHQRSGDNFKKALEEKDKDTERRIQETDLQWAYGILKNYAEALTEEAASADLHREQQEREKKEALENLLKQLKLEQQAGEASRPPPYTQQPQPQQQQQQQQQQYPQQYQQQQGPWGAQQQYYQGPYYPQAPYQQYTTNDANTAAAFAVGGASLAGMAAMSMCSVM